VIVHRLALNLGILLLAAVLLAIVGAIAGLPFGEFLGNLLFGWAMFLRRVVAKMTINRSAVVTGITCLALIWAGLHIFLQWLSNAMQFRPGSGESSSSAPRHWKLRWTTLIVGVLLLMFVAGISFIGVVHQSLWLATSKVPHAETRVDPRHLAPSKQQLTRLGWAVNDYHSILQGVPIKVWDKKGKHSWLTMIMPFSSLKVDTIDLDLDWDHPKNRPSFARVVPTYLNPEIAPFRNAEGYAVSHYAGNVHVLGSDSVRRYADVADGISHTLLAGEAASNFKAWGDPANLRDASTGINRHADGFGGPSGEGALLLTIDGSVKFYSNSTSLQVLKALAHPNDGR
jgi:hypothetical protein